MLKSYLNGSMISRNQYGQPNFRSHALRLGEPNSTRTDAQPSQHDGSKGSGLLLGLQDVALVGVLNPGPVRVVLNLNGCTMPPATDAIGLRH